MATSRYHGGLKAAPVLSAVKTASRPRRRGGAPPPVGDLEVRLAALEQERRELHQQLLEAGHVQRRLSGPRQLRRGGFDIASEVFPQRHLAGDFVSAMEIDGETWIALGDIAGKGLAAAMWFTHLASLIHCRASSQRNVASVMTAVNRDVCELRPTQPMTSMVLLRLQPNCADVEYCNAGHPPALLLRPSEVRRLDAGGPILGVLDHAAYSSGRVTLGPGDLLLGCSDGVLECGNAQEEEFGESRFVAAARACAQQASQSILFSLLGALQDFAGGTGPQDDVSLLVIRRTEGKRN